jgi:hypothetical protein
MGMVVFGGGCYEMNLWLAMEARLNRVSSMIVADCGFGFGVQKKKTKGNE